MSAIADRIREAALRHGVDPETALFIANRESGLNPAARNPRSTAGGVFQFIDSTWKKYAPGGDKFDADTNIDAGVRFIRDNVNYLAGKNLPTDRGAVYLAHFAGPGGAEKVLSAPAGTPAAALFSEGAVAANPFLAGKDRDAVIAWAGGDGKAMPTPPPASPAPSASPAAPASDGLGDIALAMRQIAKTTPGLLPSMAPQSAAPRAFSRKPTAQSLTAGFGEDMVIG